MAKNLTQSGVAELRRDGGAKTTSDREKAEILNQFFESVFTAEDDGALSVSEQDTFIDELTDFEITEELVSKLVL